MKSPAPLALCAARAAPAGPPEAAPLLNPQIPAPQPTPCYPPSLSPLSPAWQSISRSPAGALSQDKNSHLCLPTDQEVKTSPCSSAGPGTASAGRTRGCWRRGGRAWVSPHSPPHPDTSLGHGQVPGAAGGCGWGCDGAGSSGRGWMSPAVWGSPGGPRGGRGPAPAGLSRGAAAGLSQELPSLQPGCCTPAPWLGRGEGTCFPSPSPSISPLRFLR